MALMVSSGLSIWETTNRLTQTLTWCTIKDTAEFLFHNVVPQCYNAKL